MLKKRTLIRILIIVGLFSLLAMIARNAFLPSRYPSYIVYIGGLGTNAQKYLFNTKNQEFTKQGEFKANNPSYLALSDDEKYIYCISNDRNKSAIVSFSNASYQLLNEAKGSAKGSSYIINHKSHLITADYLDGSISLFTTDTSGKISKAVQQIKFVSNRRKSSHIQMIKMFEGSNGIPYLVATDKGSDLLYFYKLIKDTSKVVQDQQQAGYKLYMCDSSLVSLHEGSAPFHLDISKNGRRLYLLNQVSGEINVYLLHERDENIYASLIQSVVADRWHGESSADIHLSPSGKFLYSSHCRTRDGISIFKVDESGLLTKIGYQITAPQPTSFAITPDGDYLFVASQKDKMIQVFKINKDTGFMYNTGKSLNFNDLEPTCLLVRMES